MALADRLEQWERARAAEVEASLDRNDRLLELARHNGYSIDVREPAPGFRVWMVPPELRPITGFMIARIR